MNKLKTDWDHYYEKPARTASLTRMYTEKKLLRCFRRYAGNLSDAKILELGGANSCFFESFKENLKPKEYWIVDSNQRGLDQFNTRFPGEKNVVLKKMDVLNFEGMDKKADIVLSVGLIEHFAVEGTEKAIEAHFKAVRPGGLVIVTFPTPTWLYRATRKSIEKLGMWIFHDERPLEFDEVVRIVNRHGQIVESSISWPIFLTQGVLVVQAH